MDQDSRSVNAKDFAFLAKDDEKLWDKILGAKVEHVVYGTGRITAVQHRPNYTPLITLDFGAVKKEWPPKSFESGKTRIEVDIPLASQVDAAAAMLAAAERAAVEAARREAEELAAIKEATRLEAERWARLTPEEQHRERMAALAIRHKERLDRLGLVFKGIRPAASSRFRRVTHCYECHEELDNSVDVECKSCNWILCECGACGCGYRVNSPTMA